MSKKKILAIGAHPDDIEIGVGGTLRKYSKAGYEVKMIFVWMPTPQIGDRKQRENEGREAARILGAEVKFYNLNPKENVLLRNLIEILEKDIKRFTPDEIYTHWNYDSHQEHRILTEAVVSATRKNKCSVYMYEPMIPGGLVPHSFRAQMFVDISDVIEDKLNSISAYKSQLETYGDILINGVKGRAQSRGFQINTSCAECFEVIKEIKNNF